MCFQRILSFSNGTFGYVGTPLYSAPEQFEHPEIIGPPADVFALGVVLYEALTGHVPYPHGSDPGLYAVGKLPPPEQLTLPESLYRILCEMLRQEGGHEAFCLLHEFTSSCKRAWLV